MKTIVGLTSSQRQANRCAPVPDTPAELWSVSETPVPGSSWLPAPPDSQPLSAPSHLPPSPNHSSTCPDLPLNKEQQSILLMYAIYNKITSKQRTTRLTRKKTKRNKNNMLSMNHFISGFEVHSQFIKDNNRWPILSTHQK